MFENLDRTLWKLTSHNPVKLLRELSPERAHGASTDPGILRQYKSMLLSFDGYMNARDTWFAKQYPDQGESLITYFSAEFGLHQSIPIYSGGLGILAGDHCKEASDLGLPLAGIGFLYPQGYFHQRISADGWQQARYEPFEAADAPIRPALLPNGERLLIQVPLDGRIIDVAIWQVCVGRASLYLMDTDVESNAVALSGHVRLACKADAGVGLRAQSTGLLQTARSMGSAAATPEYLASLKQKVAARGLKLNLAALRIKNDQAFDAAAADTRQQIENAHTIGAAPTSSPRIRRFPPDTMPFRFT